MDYKKENNFYRNLLAGPFIWSTLPLLLLDLVMEIYHRVAFPLYRLPTIKRSDYIKFDRSKLAYLKWWEKLGCLYCDYANGYFPYAAAIAAATEKYWCRIKHQSDPNYTEPPHHKDYLEYGDKKAYDELEEHYQKLQKGEKEQ